MLLAACGQVERAVEIGGEAVILLRHAALARPERHDDDLATALVCLALTQREAGKPEAMLDCTIESLTIRRRLAARWPTAFQPKLARSLAVLTEALTLNRRDSEAEATAGEAAGPAAAPHG